MPRSVIGTFSGTYSASEELRLPYYGCNLAHVEPQVVKKFAKLLPDAHAAVFGEYEILFLFTYADAKGGTICFVQTLRKSFGELLDVSGLAAQDIDGIEAEASFTPQVACHRSKPSCNWNVDISGIFAATLSYCGDTAPARAAEPVEAAAAAESTVRSGYPREEEPELPGGNAAAPSFNENAKAEDRARCWRISEPASVSFDDMCSMSPEEIDRYLYGSSRKDDDAPDGQEDLYTFMHP